MDLTGKNVIYIGGFGGIGRHCLREFLAKGIQNLVVFDLKEDATILADLHKSFPNNNIVFIQLDITKKDNIESAFKEAFDKIGHFDVLVNGSGLINDRLVDMTLEINLYGPIHTTLTAMKYMDKSQGGRGGVIVNISSVAGIQPASIIAVYSAAKSGIAAFTRALSFPLYYERTGVGFITICPGMTETPLLDDPANRSTYEFQVPILVERYMAAKRQTPEVCAQNLIKVIEEKRNGATVILDMGKIEDVEFPLMWKPTY